MEKIVERMAYPIDDHVLILEKDKDDKIHCTIYEKNVLDLIYYFPLISFIV